MAAFSDSIESTFLTSIYATRVSTAPDASFNYGTSVTTICANVLGDIQPARPSLTNYRQTSAGADYTITHVGFFDVPGTVPDLGDHVVNGANTYVARNVRNFKDHLEIELERQGV